MAAEATFLSTLPARGATLPIPPSAMPMRYFYPRSPRGERHWAFPGRWRCQRISIHAPREGSDVDARPANTDPSISIHAPREGSDVGIVIVGGPIRVISIHAPREGSDRKFEAMGIPVNRKFLSTLPARGATAVDCKAHRGSKISIHAPREGSDWLRLGSETFTSHFYPRSPRGERP